MESEIRPLSEPIIQVGPWFVREMVLTWEKVQQLWKLVQRHRLLFSDLTRNDFGNFFHALTQPKTLWFEVWRGDEELVGLVWLSDLEMTVDGVAHMVFFDRQPAEKKLVCRELIKWVFRQYPLHRVTVTPPELYFATHRLLKALGFKLEGKKREAVMLGGRWTDVRIYGLTRSEVEAL
jgi:RimJ/RimL family protein N-acetyltransferase